MSVLSRKMFNNPNGRDARNKLKGMGGIMASSPELANMVQGYNPGGQIDLNFMDDYKSRSIRNYLDSLPPLIKEGIIQNKDVPVFNAEGDVIGFQPRAIDGKVLKSGEEVLDSTVPRISQEEIDRIISATDELNQNRGPGNLFDLPEARTNIGEAFYNIIETFGSIPGAIAQGAFLLTEQGLKLNPEFVAGIQSGDIPLPKGFDLAKFEEFQDETTGRPPGMVEGKIVNIGDEDALSILEARRPYKEPLVRMAETASEELSRQRGLDADAARKTAEALALTRQPYKEPLVRMAEEKKKEEEKVEDEAVQRGLDADAARKTKEALSYIAKEVSDDAGLGTTTTEKSDSLQSFIDEFNKYKPDYEGPDKGMILAKIGFAMAAGKDPNALVNIANAFNQGADMLIKDKAKRDEFNRQVDLAALQYGIGEVSKIRQEDRLEARDLAKERRQTKTFTFGPEGGVYRGKKYDGFADVDILVGDIQDNKMPTGLISSKMVAAMAKKGTSMDGLIESLVKDKVIGETMGATVQKDYAAATTLAIDSERSLELINSVLLNVMENDVTGISSALDDVLAKGLNILGYDKWSNKAQAVDGMRKILQMVIPATLGKAQTANSISNRDVEFLIGAFFGDDALSSGSFNFVMQSKTAIADRLQNLGQTIESRQKDAFAEMIGIETRIAPLYMRGTLMVTPEGTATGESALGLLTPYQKTLAEANLKLPGRTTTVGASIGYSRNPETGVLEYTMPKG